MLICILDFSIATDYELLKRLVLNCLSLAIKVEHFIQF